MTARDKANELVERFKPFAYVGETGNSRYDKEEENAKQCALIAVEELIEALDAFSYNGAMYDDYETGKVTFTHETDPIAYWQLVKEEIEKP